MEENTMPPLFAKGNRKTMDRLKRLRREAHADKAPRVALRIQGIMLSLERRSTVEIARLLKVHRSRVFAWITAWNEYREKGLLEGHRSGRPSRLSGEEKEQLEDIVDSGPVAYGFHTGVWTSPMIAQVIEDEFDVRYHPGHVRKLLKRMGFSVQRPTTRLIQADPRKQNKWIRYTHPNLKKSLARASRSGP